MKTGLRLYGWRWPPALAALRLPLSGHGELMPKANIRTIAVTPMAATAINWRACCPPTSTRELISRTQYKVMDDP